MIADTQSLKKNYQEFIALFKEKSTVLVDVKDDVSKGVAKNSMYMVFNDKFKTILPWVVKLEAPLLLITEPGKTDEIIQACREAGFANILGYLDGGFDTWLANHGEIIKFSSITAEDFKNLFEKQADDLTILDVRNKPELETDGFLTKTRLLSLKELEQEVQAGKLEDLKQKHLYLFCRLGGRSMTANSILQKYGFEKLTYIVGGFKRMTEIGMKIEKVDKQ